MKKEFYDKPIYTISNYIFGFIQSSLYFAVCNILLILFFVFTSLLPNQFNIFFLFISLIPFGPALSALYRSIGKLVSEKDIYFSSNFWSYYKNNFLSTLKLWSIQLIIITILFVDFQYFYFNNPESNIHTIFGVLIIIAFLITLYSLPINAKFEVKLKDLFVLSIYFMLKKFPITLLKVGTILLIYHLANNFSLLFLIFMPSIACFIFIIYDKFIFLEIENKFRSSNATGTK